MRKRESSLLDEILATHTLSARSPLPDENYSTNGLQFVTLGSDTKGVEIASLSTAMEAPKEWKEGFSLTCVTKCLCMDIVGQISNCVVKASCDFFF